MAFWDDAIDWFEDAANTVVTFAENFDSYLGDYGLSTSDIADGMSGQIEYGLIHYGGAIDLYENYADQIEGVYGAEEFAKFRDVYLRYSPSTHKYGGDGDDTINGYMASNWLYGGGGNDTISAYGAYNIIDGGSGNDTTTSLAGYAGIHGGSGNDTIYAVGVANTIYGDSGDDTIAAFGGANFIHGGTGSDDIYAAAGANLVLAYPVNAHDRYM